MCCQLKNIHNIRTENSWLNNLFQIRIKTLWYLKKTAIILKNKLRRYMLQSKKELSVKYELSQLKAGDFVKVHSKKEITTTLDDSGGTKGCMFTPEMYKHCNKIYKVLKTIDYFYDEVKQRMCKCKDLVILEGIVCSGRRRLFKQSCDRNCFNFWHAAWLKKIDNPKFKTQNTV